MLWPMAGMAIGLANNMTAQFPVLGAEVASIVLAAVAVFETIGPPVVARALRLANEVGEGEDEDDWSKLHTGTGNRDDSAKHAG